MYEDISTRLIKKFGVRCTLIGEMRHENLPVFYPPYSCYSTQLFVVHRGVRQGDPLPAYFFLLEFNDYQSVKLINKDI